MKAPNRFNIHLKIRTERMKDGFAPVFSGITVDGQKSYMSLKNFQTDTEHWGGLRDLGSGQKVVELGNKVFFGCLGWND